MTQVAYSGGSSLALRVLIAEKSSIGIRSKKILGVCSKESLGGAFSTVFAILSFNLVTAHIHFYEGSQVEIFVVSYIFQRPKAKPRITNASSMTTIIGIVYVGEAVDGDADDDETGVLDADDDEAVDVDADDDADAVDVDADENEAVDVDAGDDDGVNVDGDEDNKNVGDGAATVTNSVGIGLVE